MDAFLSSALAVAIAEIGDKTQLLTLFLITRFRSRSSIALGILIATLANHGLSALLGSWITDLIPYGWGGWIIGASFILIGLWILIPDKDEAGPSRFERYGPFLATLVLFFLAEIGDKTQIATVVLAAEFNSILMVTLGTTLGMLIANLPILWAGNWLMQHLPVKAAHYAACVLFIGFGVWALPYSWL